MVFSRSRSGQVLIEVLIAVSIIAILATSGFTLVGSSFGESQIARQETQGQDLVTEGLEAVRQIRDQDFSALTPGVHGLTLSGTQWTFSGTSDVTNATYTRTVTIAQIDAQQQDVTVQVVWTPRTGRTITLNSATRFTDWRTQPVPTSTNCRATVPSGDWSHPLVVGSADIGSGNSGTDVVVSGSYAYVSGVASSSTKPDLFVFDVSNPALPTLVKSIDIGAGGINSLFVKGNYLYAAAVLDSKELMIFDISTPTTTFLAAGADLTGTANGLSVIVKDTLLAISRVQSSNKEIYFYDITNPLIPSILSTKDVAGNVNDFSASPTRLYAISSAASEDILTYDITNLTSPIWLSTYNLRDGTEDISIAYQDPDTLFIGNLADQLVVVDATDPLDMTELASIATGGAVQDVFCLVNNLAFLGTTNSTKEFMILNVADLNNVTVFSSLNFPQMATGVDFSGNYVYVSVRSNDALRIIKASP